MDGFGYTLTGGSAHLLSKLSIAKRQEVLKDLFSTQDNAIGVSFIRISLGASDLDATVFSYDDLPDGQTDPELKHFSLDEDKKALIPILQEILKINPEIKFLASPWSPPAWMKTNRSPKGGSLLPEYFSTYARYICKYIQEMLKNQIVIYALTPQNEPLHPGNVPSMLMPPNEQAEFVKSLGKEFRSQQISTKIWIYDLNCDRPDYPITVLEDPESAQYVDGSAFHKYAGEIEVLTQLKEKFPDKNVYFTEQWVGGPQNFQGDFGWHVRELMIKAPRNWAKTVLEWNLAADPLYQPHTPGGCTNCLGALTIDGEKVEKNVAYYIVAHAAKFARPGSVRVESKYFDDLPNVAFQTEGKRIVLIVQNNGVGEKTFRVSTNKEDKVFTLAEGAVGTFVW